ncbi:MAG TPA: sigma 54-interacting transcriptional regulator, partial [Ktedonobacteraceae bacterium]
FNCADYAGNPQLLMAHLFGVVRGAYTGADKDRAGLVEQAHRGILFLDEVHRLPPEGQEMLFHLMDRERFRRLGDAQERYASLLLLAATTEDPASALLPTFRRRIPMTITLPGLQERTIKERYELIRTFFTTECSSIGTNIHVVPQALRALLLYECLGNVGQLRSDVQLTCARAYLEYRTHNLNEMHVYLDILPEHVRRGLLRTADLHKTLEPVADQIETTHIFTPAGLDFDSFPDSAHDLYDTISTELTALRGSGLHTDEINDLLHQDIQHYFLLFADTVAQDSTTIGPRFVDARIDEVCQSIVLQVQEQLEREFPEKLSLVMALHLTSALERLAQQRPLVEIGLQSMQITYPKEYVVAKSAVQRLRAELGVQVPESEIDVLTVLFANADTLLSIEQASVGIVIASHGRGIANGLADLANTLVGGNTVYPVELPLEQSPEELLSKVEQCVMRANQGSGVLLLVDFVSLLSLADLITQRTGIQTQAISGVSAPLIVETLRQTQRTKHIALDQLTLSLSHAHIIEVPHQEAMAYADPDGHTANMPRFAAESARQQGRVILSVCLTGLGSATKMAEIIEEHLPEIRQQDVEILCMDIHLSGKTETDIRQLVKDRQVVAIVGTINPHIDEYPFISLTDLLFGDGIARLRTLLGNTLIDPALLQPEPMPQLSVNVVPHFTQREELIQEISRTLSERLLFLNPMRVLPMIERMIEMIEVEVGETFDIEVLSGLVLHLCCVLERGSNQQSFEVNEQMRQRIEKQFSRELSICRHACHILSQQMGRPLPEEEAYNIVGILRQVDIFMLNITW